MAKPENVPKVRYEFDPVYQGIRNRFHTRHGINLNDHIESIAWLSSRLEEGFNFVPWDAIEWTNALKRAHFQPDLREKHLGFIPSVGTLAALATHGEGYREEAHLACTARSRPTSATCTSTTSDSGSMAMGRTQASIGRRQWHALQRGQHLHGAADQLFQLRRGCGGPVALLRRRHRSERRRSRLRSSESCYGYSQWRGG